MAMQSDEEWSANLESELIRIAHDQEQSYIQEQRFADGRRVAQEQQKLAQEQYEKAQEQQRMAEEQRRTLSKPKPKRIRHKQPSQVVVQPPPIAVPVPGPPPTPFPQKMTLVEATDYILATFDRIMAPTIKAPTPAHAAIRKGIFRQAIRDFAINELKKKSNVTIGDICDITALAFQNLGLM